MLDYNGHPWFDVGVATLMAYSDVREPSQLQPEHLANMAAYIESHYGEQPLKSFLTAVFPNSGFTNPAFEKFPEKRKLYAKKVAANYQADLPTTEEKCVFTGEPATAVAFDIEGRLPVGRVFRQHIPLLTGEGVINFHPNGDSGLPISGKALLAIQAMPLGCAKSAGRLLAIHSDNPKITLYFANKFLRANLDHVFKARQQGGKMEATDIYGYRTLLMNLLEVDIEYLNAIEDERPFSITAYYFSNFGQEAKIDIYHVPSNIIAFLVMVNSDKYRHTWQKIVNAAWERPPTKPKKEMEFVRKRNYLYEDLFNLLASFEQFVNPVQVARFVQTYFLRKNVRFQKQPESDPRQNYSIQRETELISWGIIGLFLKEVLSMEQERIEAIRKMGDKFARYVHEENDFKFLNKLLWARYYNDVSRILTLTCVQQEKRLKRTQAKSDPFIRLDEYLAVFQQAEGVAHLQWSLIRDLLIIRMIENLHDWGVVDLPIEDNPNEPLEEKGEN
jgi:CRISPR-associated protein Cst1